MNFATELGNLAGTIVGYMIVIGIASISVFAVFAGVQYGLNIFRTVGSGGDDKGHSMSFNEWYYETYGEENPNAVYTDEERQEHEAYEAQIDAQNSHDLEQDMTDEERAAYYRSLNS